MGNYLFSGGNTQNNDFSNFDISSLNLSDDNYLMSGGNNTRYNQYDIFKIIGDLEKENGMSGGGKNNGFSDTITNYENMINEIKNSILSKKNKLRGGGCNKCGLANSLECSCNSNISGGKAFNIGDAASLRKHINTTLDNHNYSNTSTIVEIPQKINGGKINGGKKNKKDKKSKKGNSDSLSITLSITSSSSSHSSNSVSSSSSSSSSYNEEKSIGGSDNKLSIFPFNSTTNSVSEKNFRLLRRRL